MNPAVQRYPFSSSGLALVLGLFACSDGDDPDPPGEGETSCLEVSGRLSGDSPLEWTNLNEAPDVADVCVIGEVAIGGVGLSGYVTVEPGTRVVFEAGASLRVLNGSAITARGTAEEPIVFAGEEALPGYWDGVQVESNDARNVFEHVVVRDAGAGETGGDDILGFPTPAALSLNAEAGQDPSATLNDLTLTSNSGWGLVIEGANSRLRGGARLTITDNERGAVLARPENAHVIDETSVFSGNGFDGIELAGGFPPVQLDEPISLAPLTYRVREEIGFLSALTIEPGATLIFQDGTNLAFGQTLDDTGPRFTAAGTADAPVTFTGETRTAGAWDGLVIQSGRPGNLIENAVVEFAEVGISLDKDGAFPPAALEVRSTVVRDCSVCGIRNDSPDNTLVVSDMTYADNTDDECLP